jgi:hypothetical protein
MCVIATLYQNGRGKLSLVLALELSPISMLTTLLEFANL